MSQPSLIVPYMRCLLVCSPGATLAPAVGSGGQALGQGCDTCRTGHGFPGFNRGTEPRGTRLGWLEVLFFLDHGVLYRPMLLSP